MMLSAMIDEGSRSPYWFGPPADEQHASRQPFFKVCVCVR
jgi:hypothetical protein